MQSIFGQMTIGAAPVQIATVSSINSRVSKILVQLAPGSTGNAKVGSAGVTNDNTTPGLWFASTAATNPDATHQPGGSWYVESQNDRDVLDESTYFFHGTHAGDILNYEVHIG